MPGNATDCARFTLFRSFYRKLSTESSFTFLGYSVATGSWNGSYCDLVQTGGFMPSIYEANASGCGWDTYREAVAVELRTSGQEVQAVVAQPIP